MNAQMNKDVTKAAYTKPTLIEYGSLAERTKLFGQPKIPGDLIITVQGPSITVISPSITSVVS